MNKAVFNNLIDLEYPDDFAKLSEEENQKHFSGDLMRLSFQNKDKHVLLSLAKSKDAFMNRLVSVAAVAGNSLATLEESLKEYQFIEEYESEIFGLPAINECFTYVASDIEVKQYGELSIFKYKKAFYMIYCICQYNDKDKYKKLFKEFKDSFKDIEYN